METDKKKKSIVGIVIALVAVLAVFIGIYFLYNSLSKDNLDKVQSGQTLQAETTEAELSASSSTAELSNEQSDTSSAKLEASSETTTTAPDYTAPEINILDLEGNEVNLAAFKGKTVVLNFWASWCPPCKAEFPDFQKFYDENKDNEKVAMVLVNLIGSNGETKEKADAFISENNYTVPHYYDIDGQTATTYRVQYIPTTYIINPEGELFYRNEGIMSYDSLVEVTAMAGE